MLKRIHISNIALIDKLDVEFDAGFSALTGETGAGKTILIEAVGFVLGERASRESIQSGAERGSVEAVFTVDKDGPAAEYLRRQELYEGEELTLYRELSLSGRNSCRINGTLVSAAELKALGDLLCDMHGQHAHQSLLNSRTHLELLDSYAQSNRDGLMDRLAAKRDEAADAYRRKKALLDSIRERERRLEMIAYQLKEIEAAGLKAGEEEELEAQKKRMQSAEEISEGLNAAHERLNGENGSLPGLFEARAALRPLCEFDPEYKAAYERLEEAYYTLEDVGFTLRDAVHSFQFDPRLLEEAESRLALIHSLKRKYGASIAEILNYRDRLALERDELLMGEANLEQLEKVEQRARDDFEKLCLELSSRRQEAAQALKGALAVELAALGMPNARFSVEFERVPAEQLSENGIDEAEFYLSANRGEPLKPLVKVASGGEISRIMLAFKVVLASSDHIDTLIFDEIDTGISGLIANEVAKKMEELSRSHQLLCVTHLAQIAARADRHYIVYKEVFGDSTRSRVRLLSESERAPELARIMGSDGRDKAALEHAEHMLRND
ncbi:MAG: DNA repair protein RecN [Clostridia bacterium]|nr:DNA repair protein RecN [Clostridia bacterium]